MNRFILLILAIAALGSSLMAAWHPWFSVPDNLTTAEDGAISVITAIPWLTAYYHFATIVMGIGLFILWILRTHTPAWTPAVASIWLTAIMLYPYGVMVWDPPLAGKAAWREAEHRNLIWSGGDVNTSMEYRIIGAIDKFNAVDTPNQIEPTMVGDWQASQWKLANMPELVDRIGYSDKFFEFIRKGWFLALVGGLFFVVTLTAPNGTLDATRGLWAFGSFAISFLLAVIIAWAWSFQASACLAKAAEFTAESKYSKALEQLQSATAFHPSLQENTYFIAQTGLLEELLERDSPAARLYRANVLERSRRYQQANELYQGLLLDLPPDSPVRREACRALLRSAINDLNSGQTHSALHQLETLHAKDPCNLKVNYLLQLGNLRSGRYDAIPRLVNQMDAIYKYYQYLNKQAVQYAAHDNAMIAASRQNDLDAAIFQARKSLFP